MVITDPETEIIYTGIPASPGIAFGPIHVIARGFSAPDVYAIPEEDIAEEQARFTNAVTVTKRQLTDLQEKLESLSGNKESEIFEAHVLLLEDYTLLEKVDTAIRERRQNAEFAFYAVMQNFLEAMRRIPDPYLRERTADIEDVCQRLLRNFAVDEDHSNQEPDGKHILLAYDLSPSDTASSNRKNLLGFATEQGSVNSHTAILARSFGIPAVVGLDASVIQVTALTPAVVDGYSGKLILNPCRETLEKYISILEEKEKRRSELDAKRDEATTTTDGREITLSANIEFLQELHQVKNSGAKGVGLYRTEFLLLNGTEMPDENAQTEAYSRVAKEIAPHMSIIRTLDAGGDKLPIEPLTEPEPNPFLGWRGIRVSLSRPDMFRDQLRAILRASAFGKVAVMFPLVSGLSELLQAREILQRCMDELSGKNIPFDPAIPVGVMIEVPVRRRLRGSSRATRGLFLHRHERPDPIHRRRGQGESPRGQPLQTNPPRGDTAHQKNGRCREGLRDLDGSLWGNGRGHPPDSASDRPWRRGAFRLPPGSSEGGPGDPLARLREVRRNRERSVGTVELEGDHGPHPCRGGGVLP